MKLPIGYKELEYIETTGEQYIDTLFKPTSNSAIEIIFQSSATAGGLCVCDTNWQNNGFGIWVHAACFGNRTIQNLTLYGEKNAVILDRGRLFKNGELLWEASATFSAQNTLTIFCLNRNGSKKEFVSSAKVYSLKIYDNELLVRDFVPCKNSEDEVGLYDIVHSEFYLNSGNGVFSSGPEVIYTPGLVTGLRASIDSQSVLLSWNEGENAEGYKVYRDSNFLGEVQGSATQYFDSDVSYGTHTYEVSTVNRYGESQKVSVTVTLSEEKVVVRPKKTTVVYLLDKNYDAYDAIDKFKSLLWAVRFTKVGEFELYVPADLDALNRFHEGDYAWIEDSDRLMIIEDINLQTDAEDGDYLVISGRSLESILERRIIWGMTVLTGNFQNGIKTLLNRNVISPAIESRKIPNFTFKESSDPRITELTVEAQYFGENLYEEIEKLCEEKKVGFRVLPKDSGGFEFSLYVGEDRSYNQIKNPWVVFSPNYENLQSSNYLYSKKNLKNATLVGGQGENWNRDTVEVTSDTSSGLDRREMFTDASGVTNDTSGIENDETLTEEEKREAITALTEAYNDQLKQKGQEELAKTSITETFDGEIDATVQYVYRKDFDLGDIVQIVNAYGMEASTRVSEIVISHDTTGKTIVPTFTVKEDEKGDDS